MRCRSNHFPAWTIAVLIAVGGCGSADVVDPQSGSLTVDTFTAGANPDPNAYNLRVTGPGLDVEQTIGLDDRVIFSVAPGSYTLRLGDVAANCVPENNPLVVSVNPGAGSTAAFRVVCA